MVRKSIDLESPDEIVELVEEGRIYGVFNGFRNHDTLFKLQGGHTWRQFEYHFEYHHLFSPRVRIYKIVSRKSGHEAFFLAVEGVHTVIEVKCPDRLGLLYAITRTLSAEGLDIGSARIATEIDHAYDTFYVTDRHGGRVEDAGAMARLREALEEALLKPLRC